MLLSRQQLGAVALSSTDESRYGLQVLRILPDTQAVQATDGHVAVTVTRRGDVRRGDEREEDMPGGILTGDELGGPVSLPRASAEAIAKAIPKRASVPVLANAVIRQSGALLSLGATDLNTPTTMTAQPAEGTFPNLDAVTPKDAPTFSITFNAEILMSVLKYRRTFDGDRRHFPVRFDFRAADGPAVLTWGDERHAVTALVMPCRP